MGKDKQEGKDSELIKRNRIAAEERILGKIQVKCKICNAKMLKQRQDDKIYYFCHGCQRAVWVDMPDYLD